VATADRGNGLGAANGRLYNSPMAKHKPVSCAMLRRVLPRTNAVPGATGVAVPHVWKYSNSIDVRTQVEYIDELHRSYFDRIRSTVAERNQYCYPSTHCKMFGYCSEVILQCYENLEEAWPLHCSRLRSNQTLQVRCCLFISPHLYGKNTPSSTFNNTRPVTRCITHCSAYHPPIHHINTQRHPFI
jgi:hypothetical protein